MQSSISKKSIFAIASIASLFVMLVLFICLPQTVLAQPGTLGTENPQVYCTYTDSEGQLISDPDHLPAGTYDVTFNIKGMQAVSVLQVTAVCDESVTVASAPASLISDTDTGFASEGYILEDGNIVFGFVSNNNDSTEVDSEGTALATIQMTFESDCDPEALITVSDNPNLTFVLADYADGYDDEYAFVEEGVYDGYTGQLHYLDVDISPVISTGGYTVTGSLVIMTNGSGATAGKPVVGEYTIDVYSDAERTNLLKSVDSEEVVTDGVKTNEFVIDGLATGTYYLSVSNSCAITRNDITLIVGSDNIAADAIPMVVCEFNDDHVITSADATFVYKSAAGSQASAYDLNGDGIVTAADATIVYACAAGLTYDSITIQ